MAESFIRWKRGDYVRLSRAVAKFNRKVSSLETSGNNYLPSKVNYQDLKTGILSRKELNRVVNSLKKFSKEGAEAKVTLPSKQELTKWEYSELKLARNRAIKLREQQIGEVEINNKFKGMGSEKITQYEASIDYMNRLETMRGYRFKEAKELISHIGSKQYELWRAEIYKENFMNALEEMSDYDNFELLKSKLESINNPIQFYNFISKSETLKDLFLYYRDKATAQTYGGFESNQDAFNHVLVELGIITEEELEKKQNEALDNYVSVLSEFYRRF